MDLNIKFYKIVLLKNFLDLTQQARAQLFNDLQVNATDEIIYYRRLRMLAQLSKYESQIIKKIQDFETTDPRDLVIDNLQYGLYHIIDKSA